MSMTATAATAAASGIPLIPPQPLILEQLLANADELPTLPDVAAKVTRLVEDPNVNASAIGRLVSTDQALTARVLRMANSAFYGVSRRIGTVQEAVIVLGMRVVKTITLAASLYPELSAAAPGYDLARGELWRHSVACGICAQTIAAKSSPAAPRVGPVSPGEAFVAGLLHDIGKIVLSRHVSDYKLGIRARATEDNCTFIEAERLVLGLDHARVGAAMCEKWNLPVPLVEAIGYHHDPLSASHGNVGLACVVHIADALCCSLGQGLGGDGMRYPLEPEALKLLRLPEDLDGLVDASLDALKQVGSNFDFERG